MNILIPMAGEGNRFKKAGYKKNKALIPTIYRETGMAYPMVVSAVKDLPEANNPDTNIIFIDRDFHKSEGVEIEICEHFPKSSFITIDYLTEGQASTCLLAKDKINNDDELLISACDNGIVFDKQEFEQVKKTCDVIVFTFTKNDAAAENPAAYGWVMVDNEENKKCIGCSVKKAVSNNPYEDHGIIASFWYKHGSDFVTAAEQMIEANDRINGEFYVDNVINYNIQNGCNVKVYDVNKYICWGTPRDYENYQQTFKYWENFIKQV